MIVLPAIDVLGGRAVRLARGDYRQVTVYNDDPVAQARVFAAEGAEWIHVVDLDGARDGFPGNAAIIERIVREAGLNVEVGGGIRTLATLERLDRAGAARMVLGTTLVTDPVFVRSAVELFGDKLVAGIDARDGMVAIEGWRAGTTTAAAELVAELRSLGIRRLVYTDISRDGMQTGVNIEAYRAIAAHAGFPVVASGGVSSLADVRALAALGDEVVDGVIIGRAIYEGAVTVAGALAAAGAPDAAGAPGAAEGA